MRTSINPVCPTCHARNKNVSIIFNMVNGQTKNLFLECFCHNQSCKQRYHIKVDNGMEEVYAV